MPAETLDVANISMPIAALIASLIGASATITASLINLRIAWRKEIKARANKTPVTRKSSRGPVTTVLILMVASSIGGFVLSQYFMTGREPSPAEIEFRNKLAQLNATAERLEKAVQEEPVVASAALSVPESVPIAVTAQGTSAATVALAACVGTDGEAGDQALPCQEAEATQVLLCAEVPVTATLYTVEHFALEDGDVRSWAEARVEPGQPLINGRFAGEPVERPGTDSHKLVCQAIQHWNSRSRAARIVVNYKVPNGGELVQARP